VFNNCTSVRIFSGVDDMVGSYFPYTERRLSVADQIWGGEDLPCVGNQLHAFTFEFILRKFRYCFRVLCRRNIRRHDQVLVGGALCSKYVPETE
jgi:hypothetical protein